MNARVPVFACGLLWAGIAFALDDSSQRLADRYLSILATNPAQATVLDRLWTLYANAGETGQLGEIARQRATSDPALAAQLLRRLGQPDAAVAILEKSLSAPVAAELLFRWRLEDSDAAGADAIMAASPAVAANAKNWASLGALRQKLGDLALARIAWERAVDLAPGDLALRKTLADQLAAAGDLTGARVHWQAIAEAGSPAERFAALQATVDACEQAGDWPAAVAAQEHLLRLMGPGHWQLGEAWRRLVALHERAGTRPKLEARWKSEADANPGNPLLARRMAEFFAGQPAERLAWLRRAAKATPGDTALAAEVAALELAAGNLSAAAAQYDVLLERQPGNIDVVLRRAEVDALQGDPAAAEQRVEAFLAGHAAESGTEDRVRAFYRRLRLSAPLERHLAADVRRNPNDEAAVLALAAFQLEENRFDAAADTLEKFDLKAAADPAAAAARIARMLADARMNAGALRWARRAFEIDPANHALPLAEMLTAVGDRAGARDVLRRACEASGSSVPREDLDRAYFLALQTRENGDAVTGGETTAATRDALAGLREAARHGSNAAAWLRLARWQRWISGPAAATRILEDGVAACGDPPALREALAGALADSGQTAAAVREYRALAAQLPPRAAEIERRIAHIVLDGGDPAGGLKIFRELAAQRPDDWQAAADLALAEQVNGNWFQALDMWQRAFDLAPAEARRTLRQPILNAAMRLQLTSRALDVFENICVAERDHIRDEILREAARFAVENHVADEWRARLDRRIAGTPGEASWRMGRVYLLEKEGRADDARRERAAASWRPGESPESLAEALETARSDGDWNEVCRLLERLAIHEPTPNAATQMQRAEALERAERFEAATQAWRAIAQRFARDPVALAGTADYFDRIGDEAAAEKYLEAAAALPGCNPEIFLRLGRSALTAGQREVALKNFQALLDRTQPDPTERRLPLPASITGAPLRTDAPGAPATAGPSAWTRPDDKTPEGCRLIAISQVGRLLANSPLKAGWLDRFQTPVERAWAFYHVGDIDRALDALAGQIGTDHGAEEVFALLGIEGGREERIALWAAEEGPTDSSRWEAVRTAFNHLLAANWRPAAGAAQKLFSGAPAIRQWDACQSLAASGLIDEACDLGARLPDMLPASQGAGMWLVLGEWRATQRHVTAAIECFDRAIALSSPAVTYSSPFFAAARARWLLTPEGERTAFEKSLLDRLATPTDDTPRAAAEALFAALRGEPDVSAQKLGKFFAGWGINHQTPWSEMVEQGGLQLEEWGLPRFARDLYRQAIEARRENATPEGRAAGAPGEQMLVINQLGSADPGSFAYFLNEWFARTPSNEELIHAVNAFRLVGRTDAAAAILRRLCARDPREDTTAIALLGFAEIDPATEDLAAWLERLPPSHRQRPAFQNAALRLAYQLQSAGSHRAALTLLGHFAPGEHSSRGILLPHAQALARLGHHREALEVLESGSQIAPPSAQLFRSELLMGFGRDKEAAAILEEIAKGTTPEAPAARQRLATLRGDAKPAAPPPVPGWASARLDQPGQSPAERFRVGRDFLATAPPNDVAKKELARLDRLSAANPALRPDYYVLRKSLAERTGTLPALEADLLREWRTGSHFAGEILIQLYLADRHFEALGAVLENFLTDAHYNRRAWEEIARRLLAAGQPALAARVFDALEGRAAGGTARTLLHAEALAGSGRLAEAEAIASGVARVAPLDPTRWLDLAAYYLAVGRPAQAAEALGAADQFRRLTAKTPPLWARTAREFLKAAQAPEAEDAMRRAMAGVSLVPAADLADYYEAVGALPGLEPSDLPRRTERAFRLEIARRLAARNEAEKFWLWTEATDHPLDQADWRSLVATMESSDPSRAEALWTAASTEDSLWDTRCAAAEFFLRRADAADRRLELLAKAHQIHPGSFAVARALSDEYMRLGRPAEARRVCQDVLDNYSAREDRRLAAEYLKALPLSTTLPEAG